MEIHHAALFRGEPTLLRVIFAAGTDTGEALITMDC
jgi:hypothetical protein